MNREPLVDDGMDWTQHVLCHGSNGLQYLEKLLLLVHYSHD